MEDNKESRVIVAGGRDFTDYLTLRDMLDKVLVNLDNVVIVSGSAYGADRLGEQYATQRGLKLVMFPADWETNGKAAGPIRNRMMAEYSDYLVAFWDGKSKGTKNMIATAREEGLQVRVKFY